MVRVARQDFLARDGVGAFASESLATLADAGGARELASSRLRVGGRLRCRRGGAAAVRIISRVSFLINTSRELGGPRWRWLFWRPAFSVLRPSRRLGAHSSLATFSLLAATSLTMLLDPLPAIDVAFAAKMSAPH
jgi:hypothetical protein